MISGKTRGENYQLSSQFRKSFFGEIEITSAIQKLITNETHTKIMRDTKILEPVETKFNKSDVTRKIQNNTKMPRILYTTKRSKRVESETVE